MGATIADLYVTLNSVVDPFSAGLRKAESDGESFAGKIGGLLGAAAKVGLGVGVAVAGIGIASVKAATDFQANMTKLYTAAGAPKAAVQQATSAVLAMGTQVGMTGTQMAEALYHPISAGLDMATALQVVKYAAQEAQISGANLDDTTYSLSSVMKAFNFPASQAAQTMATLNAVVGDGDMRFQDFNASIKNWGPTAAQMGMSVSSMGAGLAYLTDRGNSAEEASTRLTMGISMMATPSKQAAGLLEGLGVASSDVKGSTDAMTKVLQKSGITQNQLAADLAKPDGLYVALDHLKTALDAAGVHGTEADSAIAKIFGGGRSDKAILSLMQNLDGLKQKYDQITSDAQTSKFQQNWEDTKNTFAFQVQQMKAGAENLGIELGTKLLPMLSTLISSGQAAIGQTVSGFTGAAMKPVAHPALGNRLLNQESATPPPLTGWQRFGEEVRRDLDDVGAALTRLKPVGQDFLAFGEDAYQALGKLVTAAQPTAKMLGETLFVALDVVGKTLANVVGPAIKWFADFLDSHKTLIEYFAVGVIGVLAAKMALLGAVDAVTGIINLATSIVQFPLNQVGEISTAFSGLKTAYTGADAAEGEQAVLGLRGAFDELKTATGNALDKVTMFNGAKLSGLAQMAGDLDGVQTAMVGVEQEAAKAPEQLALFEVGEQGIVQAAGAQQLSLFETNMNGIVQAAETAPEKLALLQTSLTEVAAAEESVSANALTAAGSVGTLTSENTLASVGNLATAETAVATEGEAAAGGVAGMGSRVAALFGPVGIAVAVVTGLGIAISKLYKPAQDSAQQLQSFQDTVTRAAQGSAAAQKQFQAQASQALMAAISPGGANAGHEQDINAIDTALANLVKSGNADAAKQQVSSLDDTVSKLGISASSVASHLPQYEDALKGVADAAQTTDGKLKDMGNTLAVQQGLTQFNSDLNTLRDSLKATNGDLSSNTTAGTQNQGMLEQLSQDIRGYYQAQRNAGTGTDDATKTMYQEVQQLEALGSQFGAGKGQVDQFLGSVAQIKPLYMVSFGADISPALQGLRNLLDTVNTSTGTIRVYETGAGTSSDTVTSSAGAFKARAGGGPVDRLQTYWVGEDGPELFTPGASGYITPTGMIKPAVLGAGGFTSGGQGGDTYVTVIHNHVAGSVLAQQELENLARSQVLQFQGRNSGNGLAFTY